MKQRLICLLLFLGLLLQLFSGAVLASDVEETLLEGTPGIRGLMAQQSLSGPENADFDGEAILLYEMTSGTIAYAKNIDTRREPPPSPGS